MRKNLLIQILDALSVKYTPEYATAFYEENPNKDNLNVLSKMLNAYGVETLAVRCDITDTQNVKDAVKAVMVKDAVTPPSYSMFTTWWSTTLLSQA